MVVRPNAFNNIGLRAAVEPCGGFGSNGPYTLTLLGSQDVSSLIVSFYPPYQAGLDFGHVDLFNAQDAENLVWSPIYQWLSHHVEDNGE